LEVGQYTHKELAFAVVGESHGCFNAYKSIPQPDIDRMIDAALDGEIVKGRPGDAEVVFTVGFMTGWRKARQQDQNAELIRECYRDKHTLADRERAIQRLAVFYAQLDSDCSCPSIRATTSTELSEAYLSKDCALRVWRIFF
jgi:hypothetical protein